jgi:hypothetical protein
VPLCHATVEPELGRLRADDSLGRIVRHRRGFVELNLGQLLHGPAQ